MKKLKRIYDFKLQTKDEIIKEIDKLENELNSEIDDYGKNVGIMLRKLDLNKKIKLSDIFFEDEDDNLYSLEAIGNFNELIESLAYRNDYAFVLNVNEFKII